jgi:hypothetical protein
MTAVTTIVSCALDIIELRVVYRGLLSSARCVCRKTGTSGIIVDLRLAG